MTANAIDIAAGATLDPHSALVVIDLQQGIVSAPTTPHPAADVVARTVRLATAFRARGKLVVLVHVMTAPDGADAVPGRTDSPRPRQARPAQFAQIVPELADLGDIVVTKRNWGAFYGTDLDLQLRRRGITQIVLTGIATSMGVESTARAAHEHGYNVTVVTDAVTDRVLASHRDAVENTFRLIAQTVTTEEALQLVAEG